jgi:sporulation protein YlmC with PRC-barrel domain
MVGVISGFGEMIGASLRYFSGKLADRTRAYWPLAITGYAMNLVAIPGLAFVHSWQWAAVLIVIERTGKAIRGPARDILLSEATGVVGHGKGFGIHAAMDQTGAIIGPLYVAWAVARTHAFGPAFLNLAAPAALALASLLVARYFRPNQGTPPAAKPGEYYWCDLEGLEVVTVEGRSLGKVSHLVATGANDVLVVNDAERERLIPFLVGQFVTQVDLEGARITVDWDVDF